MLHVVLHILVLKLAANQPLEGEDRVLSVDHGLALRGEADEALTVLGERHHGWRCPCTLSVLNDARRLALHDGNT